MSDLETIKTIFDKAGIEYEEKDNALITRESEHKGVNGYSYFYTQMTFNFEGNLAEIGAWE